MGEMMVWIPFVVSALAFALLVGLLSLQAYQLKKARKNIPLRILVLGSRGKSGTVRLIRSLLANNGIPTYAKITGTVAQEIHVDGHVTNTFRFGPVSASEMADVLIRADRDGAKAGVFECMAVAPRLIAFVKNRVIRAPIIIIPTIRLDHLEDEGDTLANITKNTLSPLKDVTTLITGESNEESLKVMRWWAHKNKVTFIHLVPDDKTPVINGHHPTNVRTALALAEVVGISEVDAISGLTNVTTEPDSETGWEIIDHETLMRLSNVGGANDPQSAAEAIERAQTIAPGKVMVPILVNRWDRPLRSIAFAYSLRASAKTPHVGVIGPAHPQVRSILKRQGFTSSQIHHIGWLATVSKKQTLRTLHTLSHGHPNAWFVLVENIHSFPADQISKTFAAYGRVIKNNGDHEVEADNV